MYISNTSEIGNSVGATSKTVSKSIFSFIASAVYSKGNNKNTYNYWLDSWLNYIKPNVKESTYIRYRNSIESHIKTDLGTLKIENINSQIIRDYLISKSECGKLDCSGGLSSRTVSELLTIIKSSFKYAQSEGAKVSCSFEYISIKLEKNVIRILSMEEEKRLMSVLTNDMDRFKLGIIICLYTGIRIGELCALRWENVFLNEKKLYITNTMQRLQTGNESGKKTKIQITEPKSRCSIRTIPITDTLFNYLATFKDSPSAFVLSGQENKLVEPRTMQNHFKRYLSDAQIKNINFHALRHTFATRCIESGFDAEVLSEILGHSSVSLTLDRYVHSSFEHKINNMKKFENSMHF